MSQFVETPCRTFEAGGAIGQYLRVKLSSGVLAAAGAAELALGTIEREAFASGEKVPVRLPTAQGTRKMVASAAVTQYATVYGATGGKVSSTANGNPEGIALEAASADGDIIEVLPLQTLDSLLGVVGVAAGYKVARGETALDGSNPTSVAHGLTTCVAFVAMLKGTAAPGVGTSILTSNINGANVDVYAWKVTGAGDTTLIASTGTESFYWVAVGT